MRQRAQAKGLRLIVEPLPAAPPAIWTDVTRARQILVNLVGNAIKFTEEGRGARRASAPTASARLVRGGRHRDRHQPRAAGEAVRAVHPGGRHGGATPRRHGAGLWISRKLARLLGGGVTVESELGKGSRFRATFGSTAKGAGPTARPPTLPQPANPLRGRVLLAEDGADNRALLERVLRRAGLEVELASDGREAHAKAMSATLSGTPFDVVLLDSEMPEMSGNEAASALRADGYDGAIVALTAHGRAEDREACLSAGCDEFATKPIDRTSLLATLARFLDKPEALIAYDLAMQSRFAGKVVLITGAASGIGRASAERIAGEGGALFLLDVAAQGLRGDREEGARAGRRGRDRLCDVSDRRGERRGRGLRAALRPARLAVQHRGHPALRPHARARAREVAQGPGGESRRHVLHVPGRAAAPAREQGQRGEHVVDRRARGSPVDRGVFGVEGRDPRAHLHARDRVLRAGPARERDLPGLGDDPMHAAFKLPEGADRS